MKTDWVSVFESPSPAEVQFIQGMLRQNAIESVIVNKNDSMHIHLNAFQTVELHVSTQDVVQARYHISKHTA